MTTDVAVRPFKNRLAGVALHILVSGLPMGVSIVLLSKLLGWGTFSDGPAGPIVFTILFAIFSVGFEAWAGKRWPRLYPVGVGRICFDPALSSSEKFARLHGDAMVARHMLTQLATVSLLALAVLTVW